ncbi:transcriptional regulator, LacI family [Gracilibacillus orientalis]|uniref:Transcriptional regulator, LacI family n=1 Tax=Gracilibacillus orientalis TaxID=334253 RepID=A0A1I4R2W7_9BACI|nr:LacI family DNA-binding transcriptional regulator [Gracilibacillus orientalis]SFM46652.1 transcriptional regulator, LacI family [Gracilibacillus orientalis]
MPTIKDVAKYANVSVATVSRVLNKKGYVSKEAEENVLKAIADLNYKPNSVARSLYHKTSKMIGLLIPDISNPFFPELARAVEDVALTYGYTVVICNTDEDIRKEAQYLEALQQKYIDGLILTTNQLSADNYENLGIPLVALDRQFSNRVPTVSSKNYEGARQATEYLIENGSEFIAHIRGPYHVKPADDRYQGFKDVVEEQGIAHIVVDCDFTMASAMEVTEGLFEKYSTIDAVFASSDIIAAGVLKVAKNINKRIPEDLQIIGFDGIPLGEMLTPALTTVAQPIYKMGALSARLLIKQIEKEPLDLINYEVKTTIQYRETTRSDT